jgi:sodium transport system permease protein
MMNRVTVVFLKELIDNLRDRRSVLTTLGYAIIGPGMILLTIVLMGSIFHESVEKPLELPISGRENAPALVQFLEQNNVILQEAPANPREAVRNGDVDVVLIIPDDYGEDFSAGRPATVQIVADSSRTSAMTHVRRAQNLVERYGRQIGALRLLARGISPDIINAVSVREVDVSTPQSQAFFVLGIMPYLLIFAVFSGGAAIVIDTTAGERERNSLEPLLINPVKRWELVLGKLLASLPFAIATVLISLVAFGAAINLFPVERFMGVRLSVDLLVLVCIFFICLPMVLLTGALQMIIASFTHTYKEAQTYLNWLPLIPALPGLALALLPVKATTGAMLIPTYGQQVLISQIIRGEVITPLNVVVSTAVTLVVAAILTLVAISLYSREDILFGKK